MKMFQRAGLEADDRILDLVEWSPAAPVGRTGPAVNRRFETSMPGLYACGEAACPDSVVTGLASAATSGAKAGQSAAAFAREAGSSAPDSGRIEALKERTFAPMRRGKGTDSEHVLLAIQESVIPYDILLIRDGERMRKSLGRIETLRDSEAPLLFACSSHHLRSVHEALNLLTTAEIHLRASLFRKDSRTGIREDYPFEDNMDWLKFVRARKGAKHVEIFSEDVPIEKYPIQVARTRNPAYLWQMGIDAGVVRIEGGKIEWV
jgi:succinate dehydrogenase/fumarate reductase flavoprotein subunit